MTIGILETGDVPAHLVGRFGPYDAMMRRLVGPERATTTYRVHKGHWPDQVEAHDAYVVTGSSAGAYDPLPWIALLEDFLRAAGGRAKLVGICFGHQVMAQAFGGRVVKSAKGWGLGLHRYDIVKATAWMDGERSVAVAASHQDQVVEAPPGAEVVGGSTFTPLAILHYPARQAVSFQFHPEFEPAFAEALVEMKRSQLATGDADRALASLRETHDAARVAGWIRRFLAD
jgi:GMP synthase-like glutamine amidotransferase